MNNLGFSYLPSEEVIENLPKEGIEDFLHYWEDLPDDQYISADRRYRKRRYCRFLYRSKSNDFVPLKHSAFFQSKSINKVFGGVNRWFEPSTKDFINSAILEKLIRINLDKIALNKQFNWEISVQQIRVTATHTESNPPAPEGLHRDDFI